MMRMNIGYLLTTYEFEQMSKYLDLVQTALQQHLKKLEATYLKDMAREVAEDETTVLEDHYIDEFIEAGHDFPRLLLLSFIVTWYSFVEQKLLDICENLQLGISLNPRDDKNLEKGIERARRILREAQKYEINEKHWRELCNIRKLRNVIVHEGKRFVGSYFKPEKRTASYTDDNGLAVYVPLEKALFCYLLKHGMTECSGLFFEIMPTFEYCEYLVKFGKELFSKLYVDLKPSL